MGNSTYDGWESAAERSKRLGGAAIVITRSPQKDKPKGKSYWWYSGGRLVSSHTKPWWWDGLDRSSPQVESPDAVRRRWEARLVRRNGQAWVDRHRGLLDEQWELVLHLGLVPNPVFPEAQKPKAKEK